MKSLHSKRRPQVEKSRRRGEAVTVVLVVLAVVGGLFVAKPQWFPGASKRAAQSAQATANVTATTQAADAAANAQAAAAAASVVKIGEANAASPASPSKDFIAQEVPVALERLPKPDPAELIAAERRRAAVMEGQRDEARRLYEQAAKDSARLQSERDAALAAREAATRERQAADLALEKAAAAEHARTTQLLGAVVLIIILLAVVVWVKANGVSLPTIGKIAAKIRGGVDPIEAIDDYLTPRMKVVARRAAQLATPPKDS